MRRLMFALPIISLLAACSEEPGSEAWCESKKAQSKAEWSADDALTFATRCVVDSQTIGSEFWCSDLKEKPKGDWTASEAADFARYCVL